jgi:S1-C subfamily serine protease
MRDRFLLRLVLLGLLVFLAVGLWRSLSGTGDWFGSRERDAVPRAVLARGDLAADELSTIELFERARDSVVFISTSRQVQDFWTRNVLSVPRGSGSGFIWDDAGHVVTNFHVIQGASEATVRLADGRDYKASLAGVSPAHDIAVLRIGVDFKRPPPVPVGTSEDLKVGQKVFAIGNPFGLDWTLTTGIISALDRSLPSDSGQTIEHLIQTDAAINPGSSGGPLLDSAGRLIGINTAIFSTTGESVGIGFAVPVDTVNRVVPELIRQGRYVRPVLGIDIDERINRRIVAMTRTEGVFVLRVTPGSAAEASGLRGARIDDDGNFVPGDVIVGVAGRRVTSVGELLGRLDEYRAGEPASLNVLRDGGEIEVVVILQPGT